MSLQAVLLLLSMTLPVEGSVLACTEHFLHPIQQEQVVTTLQQQRMLLQVS